MKRRTRNRRPRTHPQNGRRGSSTRSPSTPASHAKLKDGMRPVCSQLVRRILGEGTCLFSTPRITLMAAFDPFSFGSNRRLSRYRWQRDTAGMSPRSSRRPIPPACAIVTILYGVVLDCAPDTPLAPKPTDISCCPPLQQIPRSAPNHSLSRPECFSHVAAFFPRCALYIGLVHLGPQWS